MCVDYDDDGDLDELLFDSTRYYPPHTAETVSGTSSAAPYPHPNDVDRKRIERAVEQRQRYRYVKPSIKPIARGYLVESPCCSRNIDRDGGVIAIAKLEYNQDWSVWELWRFDHQENNWTIDSEFTRLNEVLERLNSDPERVFWQ